MLMQCHNNHMNVHKNVTLVRMDNRILFTHIRKNNHRDHGIAKPIDTIHFSQKTEVEWSAAIDTVCLIQ